jgi:hypothetical protein
MRSAAVILTQHRRSRRSAIQRYDRALPRRIVGSRCNLRRDGGNESRNDARVLPRPSSNHARCVRRRFRPDVLIPRGFLPLVVH